MVVHTMQVEGIGKETFFFNQGFNFFYLLARFYGNKRIYAVTSTHIHSHITVICFSTFYNSIIYFFRQVVPSVKPGYLRPLVPEHPPQQAEPWTAVMADIERVVMSGVTHWHSPRFHAYFPTAQSYPAIVADMLSGAIACIGFTWVRYWSII